MCLSSTLLYRSQMTGPGTRWIFSPFPSITLRIWTVSTSHMELSWTGNVTTGNVIEAPFRDTDDVHHADQTIIITNIFTPLEPTAYELMEQYF